jgi:Arc/MetJ family transcription regulator
MRTNIVLDDKLVADAMRLARVRSKREVVDLALREMVLRRRRRNVLDLVDQELIAPDYDVRKVRAGMGRNPRAAHGTR